MRIPYILLLLAYLPYVYTADHAAHRYQCLLDTFDSKTLISNAYNCYKERLYDISSDLCNSILIAEKQSCNNMDIAGIQARLLLGLNLLQTISHNKETTDKDHFDYVEQCLLEVCCNLTDKSISDQKKLICIQRYAWDMLAKLYATQQERRKIVCCLFNTLAVQYNSYNDTHPYQFPSHRPGQLRGIAYLMKQNKECALFIEQSTAQLDDEPRQWFLKTLFERAWRYDDSLDGALLLAHHNKKYNLSESDDMLSILCALEEAGQKIQQEPYINLEKVSIALFKDHPELVDALSMLWCKHHNYRRYSQYKRVRDQYIDYSKRCMHMVPIATVFIAVLDGLVVGRCALRKMHYRGFDENQKIYMNMLIDETYKKKGIGAKLATTVLQYAQQSWQADRVTITFLNANKTLDYAIDELLERLHNLQKIQNNH